MRQEQPHHQGTAANALKEARALPPPTIKQVALMKKALADQRDPNRWRDPWKKR